MPTANHIIDGDTGSDFNSPNYTGDSECPNCGAELKEEIYPDAYRSYYAKECPCCDYSDSNLPWNYGEPSEE